jgi:hypothetical protein
MCEAHIWEFVCVLGICKLPLRPLICIFEVRFFCILIVLQLARPVWGMHVLTLVADGQNPGYRGRRLHPIPSEDPRTTLQAVRATGQLAVEPPPTPPTNQQITRLGSVLCPSGPAFGCCVSGFWPVWSCPGDRFWLSFCRVGPETRRDGRGNLAPTAPDESHGQFLTGL